MGIKVFTSVSYMYLKWWQQYYNLCSSWWTKTSKGRDQELMSIAIKNFHKAAELKAIKRARMMIGLTNVSDVFTSDGKSMNTSFLLSKQKYRRKNGYKWPLKHHVLSNDYTAWRKLLDIILYGDNHQLINRLRRWITREDENWLLR